MASDFPDPTVLRVGRDYWATATNHGSLQPVFQLARSRDLVNWRVAGSVFPQEPQWASSSWWAPSLVSWRGRFLIYYSATPRSGQRRCIGVAVADRLPGPWTDNGTLLCGENAIDPTTTTDPSGQRLLLLWAAPGGIFAQQLNDDGTAVTGAATNVLGGGIENPTVIRRGGFYVLLYSAGGCCGFDCRYSVEVARSLSPFGPFVKHERNPILSENRAWRCPGGNDVVDDGKGNQWLVYHAYSPTNFGFAGRQMLLDRLTWSDDWPVINGGRGPSAGAVASIAQQQRDNEQFDGFAGRSLGPRWQWVEDRQPGFRVRSGRLQLTPPPGGARAQLFFGTVPAARWTAETAVTGRGGVGAYWGGSVGIERQARTVRAWLVSDASALERTVKRVTVPPGGELRLRLTARFNRFTFAIKRARRPWRTVASTTAPIVSSWVFGTSLALTARQTASFDYARLTSPG
jgi:beta-xylosidase